MIYTAPSSNKDIYKNFYVMLGVIYYTITFRYLQNFSTSNALKGTYHLEEPLGT